MFHSKVFGNIARKMCRFPGTNFSIFTSAMIASLFYESVK